MTARIENLGKTAKGQTVQAIHLLGGELRATILTYGATLQDVRLAGTPWPLTLGATSVAAYEGPFAYFGAIVGPVANRIAGAAAEIDGRKHQFAANEAGKTTLHGGPSGTHAQVWTIEAVSASAVTLGLHLPDGLGGFPGNRQLRADFQITAPATLSLTMSATTDAPTLVNLANHSYWNLDGGADTSGHRLTVAADTYLPVDSDLIPLAPRAVGGTDFDFRAGRRLDPARPLDHNFCLSAASRTLTEVAMLSGSQGVCLRLETTAPGLQVYDGRGLQTRPFPGLTGQPYGPNAGVALEAQHWPDAPGRPDFPSIALSAGENYREITAFSFTRVEMG